MKQDLLGLAETRGHPRKLSKSRYVRRLGKDSFAFRVVNPWNKLPLDVVMAPNLNPCSAEYLRLFSTPGYTREPPSGASRRSGYTREPHYKG